MITDNTTKWKVSKITEFAGRSLPVGFMHFSLEKEVPAGELPAFGYLYNRTLYADLWTYAQTHDLVISESEWQAIASANDGNCAYYSDGDGSTNFRVPSIKCWVKGANSTNEVGSYLEAGSPNVTGEVESYGGDWYDGQISGAFYIQSSETVANTPSGSTKRSREILTLDASRSSSVYRDDIDTVQPPSLVGMWLIVAFGVAHNIGEADVANVMQAVEQVQTGLSKVDGISDYIIESYRNGTEWYEVYRSGKVRQGGHIQLPDETSMRTYTFHLPFADISYSFNASYYDTANNGFVPAVPMLKDSSVGKQKTSFTLQCWISNGGNGRHCFDWVAEGQGA